MFFTISLVGVIGLDLIIAAGVNLAFRVLFFPAFQAQFGHVVFVNFAERRIIFKTLKIVVKGTGGKNRTVTHVYRVAGGNIVDGQTEQGIFLFKFLDAVHNLAEIMHAAAEFAAFFHKIGNRPNVGLRRRSQRHLLRGLARIDGQHFEDFFFAFAGADGFVYFENTAEVRFRLNRIIFVADRQRIERIVIFHLDAGAFFGAGAAQVFQGNIFV